MTKRGAEAEVAAKRLEAEVAARRLEAVAAVNIRQAEEGRHQRLEAAVAVKEERPGAAAGSRCRRTSMQRMQLEQRYLKGSAQMCSDWRRWLSLDMLQSSGARPGRRPDPHRRRRAGQKSPTSVWRVCM